MVQEFLIYPGLLDGSDGNAGSLESLVDLVDGGVEGELLWGTFSGVAAAEGGHTELAVPFAEVKVFLEPGRDFEAARAATERQFSRLKSPHESGIQDLKRSPRREPMICVLIGLWVAATNLAIQDSFCAPGEGAVDKNAHEKFGTRSGASADGDPSVYLAKSEHISPAAPLVWPGHRVFCGKSGGLSMRPIRQMSQKAMGRKSVGTDR